MGAAFLITLREGLEAALILSILLAYLRRIDRMDRARTIWLGAAAAAVVSLIVGTIIFGVGAEFEGTAEEVFEGLVSLTAVGVLTWMVFWMRRQGARMRTDLQERVDSALVGGGLALAGLAFAVVVREGIETALFVFAAAKATAVESGGASEQLLGATLGLVAAGAIGALLYRGAVTLNIRAFFKITGALILVVAAGLLAFSVHELQEAGWLPFLTAQAYDTSAALPHDSGLGAILHALIGYNATPSVLEVVAWAGYLIVTGTLYLRRQPALVSSAAVAPDGSREP